MLIPIDEKEFKEKVKIKFNNISQGFNLYDNKIIEAHNVELFEVNMSKFLEEAIELNGLDNSYVDFYYNILSENDKINFKSMLDEEDKEFIINFEKSNNNGIYYKLSKQCIPFINKLNSREILFSTIYFTKEPLTVWGNYNKKFPVFYLESKVLDKYRELAKKHDLIII